MSSTQNVSDFKSITQRQHVLRCPEMYVGSMNEVLTHMWVVNDKNGKNLVMEKKEVPYIEALVKIINELIDNSVDNMQRDPPTTEIRVKIDNTYITVINNGKHIPCVQKDFQGQLKWIPEKIFGDCLSGTNFRDNRNTIGMNGLGVKLANILSSDFMIELYDPIEKKLYYQNWHKNMTEVDEPTIMKKKSNKTITKVTMKPQMKLFNKQLVKDGTKPKIVSLSDIASIIKTRLLTISATMKKKLKIYFNDKQIKTDNFKQFVGLHTSKSYIYEAVNDDFEYGITVSPTGSYEHQSFVNGLQTVSDKSTHTKYVTNFVVNVISSYLEKKYNSRTGGIKLEKSSIKNKIMVFVNIKLKDPVFTSQTKVELSSPIQAKEHPLNKPRILKLFRSTGMLEALENELQKKTLTIVDNALNSNKARNLTIDKLDDAHNAGTAKSKNTMLFLVEGDSAKTFVSIGLSVLGRVNYGVFPMKGKILNVRDASDADRMKNKEIVNIMKILGLSTAKKYETEEEFKQLRYGKLCILTDADDDGKGHIAGLLMSFIEYYWPALLSKHKFLYRFDTPIIKAVSKSKQLGDKFFFTNDMFDEFSKDRDFQKYTIQHLKGLGTSERKDAVRYFKNIENNLKEFEYDDMANFHIQHVFGKDKEHVLWRKKWMVEEPRAQPIDYKNKIIKISDFLNTDTHQYSVSTLRRGIPNIMDGMKSSQRKITFACFKKFGSNGNSRVKVAQLAAYVASVTNYAHGEESLNKAIIKMAQTFVGSNNIPILQPLGSFGSRLHKGSDYASPRYIFTCLSDDIGKIFKKEDENVLEYLVEEGYEVEPKFYVPQLPLALINGTRGLATGFTSNIPSFNPDDIRRKIISKLRGVDDPFEMVPWYRGYSTNNKTRKITDNKWIVYGSYELKSPNTIVITEIPITQSIEGYKTNVLTKLLNAKKVVKKFQVSHIDENTPRFVVETLVNYTEADHDDIMNTFRLFASISMSKFNLLDVNDKVISFTKIDDILDYWFKHKIEFVEKRRKSQIAALAEKIDMLRQKLKFIESIIKGDIDMKEFSQEQVEKYMIDNLMIAQDYCNVFLKIPIRQCTSDNVHKLKQEIKQNEETQDFLEKQTYSSIYLNDLGVNSSKRPLVSEDKSSKKLKV